MAMAKSAVRHGDYLVWMDCEMTGLEPEHDVLLEMATIITDSDLKIIAEGPVLTIRQSEAKLKKMNRWCRNTHTKSGLIERVRNEGVPAAEAERATLRFLRRHCKIGTAPLCGNSIGQDRRFLVKYMPTLHNFFHYQSIDVSTVKQLVRRWYGKSCRPPQKSEEHRALADIRESIAELAFYRQKVFIKA
jgi:oligoribonuclease